MFVGGQRRWPIQEFVGQFGLWVGNDDQRVANSFGWAELH